ncbi:hypothetical protein OKA04_18825 [Luteolibacter flavescens]|uniref:Uncharacterized protein n=1 Tax=Luteolibacter flavescens TaxID=1859460 RepID=A0ABT3FT99_9BACT|nr:hypothetical protein [Luteolibacter flavescens]MCW1886801.1 hypothetical protein [Luteolibacter flavescens]
MARDERKRHLVAGMLVIAFMGLVGLILVIGTTLPGLIGEVFTKVVGFLTSPFLLEGSLIFAGFTLVILINSWRRHRDGDEFVYLDELNATSAAPSESGDLPSAHREIPGTVDAGRTSRP